MATGSSKSKINFLVELHSAEDPLHFQRRRKEYRWSIIFPNGWATINPAQPSRAERGISK